MAARTTQSTLGAFMQTRKRAAAPAVSKKSDIAEQPQKRAKPAIRSLQVEVTRSTPILPTVGAPASTTAGAHPKPAAPTEDDDTQHRSALPAQPPPRARALLTAAIVHLHDEHASPSQPASAQPTAASEDATSDRSSRVVPPRPPPPRQLTVPLAAPRNPLIFPPVERTSPTGRSRERLTLVNRGLTHPHVAADVPRPPPTRPSFPALPRLTTIAPPPLPPPTPEVAVHAPVLPPRLWGAVIAPLPASLTLPVGYQLLASMYSALDCTLGVRSASSMAWSTLRPSMARVVQKTVSLAHLQQLLFLLPDVLGVRETTTSDGWGRSTTDYRITTSSPSSSTVLSPLDSAAMTHRRQTLEHRLRTLVQEEHDRWWRARGEGAAYDVRGMRVWHADFPLEATPPVPRAEVTPLPETKAAMTVLDAVIARRAAPAAPRTPSTAAPSSSSSPSSASSLCATPSSRSSVDEPSTPFTHRGAFVEHFRLRALSRQLDSLDRETPEQLLRLQHLGKLPLLLDVVHFVFTSPVGKPFMEEADLLQRLSAGNVQFANAAQLREEWGMLLAIVPGAFVRREVSGGRSVVGLRKSTSMNAWKAQLKAHKDSEERSMAADRAHQRQLLKQSGLDAGDAEPAPRPRVESPAKRSLMDALSKVSPEGGAVGGKGRQLYQG